MKKVLILSYFFPSCNMPGANRAYSWAKYLHLYGFYPIIITRSWNHKIKMPLDLFKQSGSQIEHKREEHYEVYHLPYNQNLRDKIYCKYGESKMVFIRKTLTYLEHIFQNFVDFIIPFYNIYKFAENYLKKNPDVKLLVISASPFILFKFGYKLKKKYGTNWIADYRDGWNTSEWTEDKPRNIFSKLLIKLESISEKKWVSTASCILSVSKDYQKKISEFTGIKGKVLFNGFFEEEFANLKENQFYEDFTITYSGSIYDDQNIEIFFQGFKKFINNHKQNINIRLYFLGLAFYKKQKQRILNYLKGYEKYVLITERMERNKAIDILLKSQVLLLFPTVKIKGVPASKIYEYIASKKPVILCPSDGDIMESTLKETGSGFICNNSEEVVNTLNALRNEFLQSGKINITINQDKIYFYSRKEQTKVLAELLEKINS